MLAVLAMLIFFMWRNSKKRKEELAKLQESMVPGAEVMTNFGLFGTLLSIDEENNIAVIETSPGNAVKVHRQTLARVVDETDRSDAGQNDAEEGAVTADADATPEAPGTPAKND
ncbi:preprotein translocase subunit YajC [Yonghaparkia sp. Root332]|uniref:preprotein translocase subunit YajC n=2 Tax=unclassified Microcella TaxID=2630066 RepID=UPI001F4706D6|nr:preprotein translocase subunit YajC [Yonghaparkia sp. Root332]